MDPRVGVTNQMKNWFNWPKITTLKTLVNTKNGGMLRSKDLMNLLLLLVNIGHLKMLDIQNTKLIMVVRTWSILEDLEVLTIR